MIRQIQDLRPERLPQEFGDLVTHTARRKAQAFNGSAGDTRPVPTAGPNQNCRMRRGDILGVYQSSHGCA